MFFFVFVVVVGGCGCILFGFVMIDVVVLFLSLFNSVIVFHVCLFPEATDYSCYFGCCSYSCRCWYHDDDRRAATNDPQSVCEGHGLGPKT